MVYIYSLPLCLVLALATAQRHPVPIRGAGAPEHLRRLGKNSGKNGKNGKNGGGNGNGNGGGNGDGNGEPVVRSDGSTVSAFGVEEQRDCLPFNRVEPYIINSLSSDPACATEESISAMTQGCCRIFNYLELDDENDLSHLQCVCGPTTRNQAPTVDVGGGNGNGNGNGTSNGTNNGTSNGSGNGGDDRDGGGSDPIDICVSEFQNRGWGAVPSDLSVVPSDLTPGDCRADNHCGLPPGSDTCCLKHMCICGKIPRSREEDCLP
eukprot:CAMPEP_0117031784 /NCGR_PEP_ID=MMETSP0472-20121206/22805_1 /TAXON_ID=693140 ORGANISM="Tiarina fusus, Strain LIS" /NCGR_SAMPLE_ID=MMETSP0472 /ASSEMBLY_ACC=CAM_ASM_000603 /LENGTH=263 /DNA_ID=CAMNT_0004740181 /DNA_START=77 /DNA_END=871 /DNA_ORIENTATION=-